MTGTILQFLSSLLTRQFAELRLKTFSTAEPRNVLM